MLSIMIKGSWCWSISWFYLANKNVYNMYSNISFYHVQPKEFQLIIVRFHNQNLENVGVRFKYFNTMIFSLHRTSLLFFRQWCICHVTFGVKVEILKPHLQTSHLSQALVSLMYCTPFKMTEWSAPDRGTKQMVKMMLFYQP